MSWPLSVKHAAKITFAQYKCRTFQSIIYPADKNNFIGISSILAWGKSLPPPFIAKVGMFAGKVCCTSRRNKCRSHVHTLLLRAKHTLPFLYEETTIVLRARLTRKVRQTHEQNGAWTVPLWFLGSRLVCSSKIIATFLAIWRLPSSKVRTSALRTWTKTSFRVLRWQHIDTRGLHTKTDRIAATNGTKWRTRKYKTETMTTFGTSAMEQIR